MADANTPLSNDQIQQALANLPGWSADNDELAKTFKFSGFEEAVSFIIRVALHAQEQQHHPEIINVFNQVTIKLCTHDAGGKITQRDADLAQRIQEFDWTGS